MIRTNLTRLFLLLACALAFAGCGPKAPVADSDADVAALTSAAAGWEQAYNDKDADAVAAIYAEDAQLLPHGAPAVNGRAAIREHYANEIATAWAKISVVSDANGRRWRLGMALGNLECRNCASRERQVPGGVAPHRGGLALVQGHLEFGCPEAHEPQ